MPSLDAHLVYKICPASEWSEAVAAGTYRGSGVDRRDGFIHLSTSQQLEATLRLHFAGQRDLVLVAVDPDALGAALRWEPSRGGALFPHLYGELPVSLARSVQVDRRARAGLAEPLLELRVDAPASSHTRVDQARSTDATAPTVRVRRLSGISAVERVFDRSAEPRHGSCRRCGGLPTRRSLVLAAVSFATLTLATGLGCSSSYSAAPAAAGGDDGGPGVDSGNLTTVSFQMAESVPAGGEIFDCQYVQLPDAKAWHRRRAARLHAGQPPHAAPHDRPHDDPGGRRPGAGLLRGHRQRHHEPRPRRALRRSDADGHRDFRRASACPPARARS